MRSTSHPAQRAVQDAYRRAQGPVAYLDESYQLPDGIDAHRGTFYIFTATVVDLKDLDALRRELGELAGDRHWHTRDELRTDDGRARIRDMLGYLAEGVEPCVIAHQVVVDAADTDGELARQACYQALATDLANGRPGVWDPVDLLLLEERNQLNLKARDQANHKELVSGQRIPRHARLLQVSPACERLLWLPDLVASAFRHTITHAENTLFEIIEDQVHFVTEVGPREPASPPNLGSGA